MNKFKKILLGALSVLTLGLVVVTGTKVDAKDVTRTYNFDLSKISGQISANDNYQTARTLTTTANNSTDTKTLTFTANQGDSSFKYDSSNSCLSFGKYKASETNKDQGVKVSFESLGSGSITMNLNTQSTSRYFNIYVYKDSELVKTTTNYAGSGTNAQWSTNLSAGNYLIKISFDTTATSTNRCHGITFVETVDDGAADYDYAAADTAGTYHTVTFNAGSNGSISSPSSLKYYYEDGASSNRYNSVEWPTATPNDGYIFVGWYNDVTEYDDTMSITSDIILTAKFEAITIESGTFIFGSSDQYTTSLKESGIVSYTKYQDANRVVTWSDGESMSSGEGETIEKSDAFITLKLYKPAKIKFYGVSNNNSTTTNVSFINSATSLTVYEVNLSNRQSTNATIGVTYLEAGTYNFSTGGQNVIAYKLVIEYVTSNSTSVVEKQTATVSSDLQLRLIGTLTNITDITKLESVKFVLTKDNKNAKKDAEITTVYTSVKDTKISADNTYYAVFKLTGMNGITGSFTARLVYVYDGVTYISPIKSFSLS